MDTFPQRYGLDISPLFSKQVLNDHDSASRKMALEDFLRKALLDEDNKFKTQFDVSLNVQC